MKKLLLSCLLLCVNLLANAQATDLIVHCPNAGQLKNLISEGDKQTVRNLKVTGTINKIDLKFIGSLTELSLKGVVDLGDANIAGNSWDGAFKTVGYTLYDYDYHLEKLVLPKSLTSYEEHHNLFNTEVDTLVFDTQVNKTTIRRVSETHGIASETYYQYTFHRKIGHLILGENVDSISTIGSAKTVHFPSSIKYIAEYACMGISDLSQWNIKEFPNLEELGYGAFVNFDRTSSIKPESNGESLPDSMYLPNIYAYNLSSIEYKNGMHIFFGDKLDIIGNGSPVYNDMPYHSSWQATIYNVSFHFKSPNPPSLGGLYGSSVKVYVPKGAKLAYVEKFGNNFEIIEDPQPLEEIRIDEHKITLEVGESKQLSAVPIPDNADDATILWDSDNKEVAIVNSSGLITAVEPGVANIIAMSSDGEIRDTCVVTVNAHAESVSLSETSITLENIGDSYKLENNVLPENAVDKSVTWKSSNEQVCMVSASGLVTATGVGSAVVTVTTVDGGHSATCVVKVLQHVTGLMMEKHSTSLKVGENEQLKVVVNPDNADDISVDWSSSNEQLATVDANGKVTAIKAGEVWVKAVSKDNEEAKDSCKVTVIQPVSSVNLTKTNVELNNIGESIQLEAVIMPEDASDKSVTWKSSNEQVCSVSNNGLVSATGAGNAIVTVTTTDGGHTANCLVKVIQHVTGLTMEKHSTSLKVGENEQLKVVVNPDNADDKSVDWSSSNEQLATVDANGNVKAIKAGDVWVKAVSKDNAEAKDSCKVTVIQPVTGISLVQTNVELNAISENIQLEVVIMPEDASDKSVTWKSSNEQVCVVSPSGLLTATGAGSAVVTVTTVDGGFSATCVVKVIQHVNSLSLDRTAMELKVAETDRLVATVLPDNSDDKTVLWDSSNEQIATVDANGNVTAITTGEVWVKAVSKDNAEAKDSCKVTVIQPVTGITLSESNITFNNVGETKQLVATVEPENASNKDVIWSSSNENVCIVNNGMVTAVSAGTTTVTATTVDGNFAATCIVKVVQHVTKVELNNYTLSLKVGETGRLTATVSPDNAENKSVNWFSSDEQVATVDANGNVTAIKAGETWINVVSKDNAEAKDSCKITVIQPVTGIVLSQESYHLTNIGETIQLEATVLPDDASNKEVKWTSSNENICMVSNGKVVAMGYGNAVIIATTIDGGFMASCAIIVEKESIPVTSITLSQTSVTLAKGESLQLTATVLPSDATNKTLIWKSSDENVCVTTQTGMIIAVNEGTAVITVVPESGVGQAQCNVIVNSDLNAIREINKAEKTPEQIYDMMGRKVDRVVKGRMYIRNGQKFIAK